MTTKQMVDHIEAARQRDIDPDTVKTWIDRGYLKAKAGTDPGRYSIDPDELDDVIAARCG
ncbi:MAG TPA: hypothetical protein VFH83_01530 [Spirochaetia bacterium]|nr:hypothetical protein [Spirochaetia bacterium]